MKRTIGLLFIVALLITACGKQPEIGKLPYCPKDIDICSMAMHVSPVGHDGVHGYIQVKTQREPEVFLVHATLEWKHNGTWVDQDEQYYRIHSLPSVGLTKTLEPVLITYC